MFFERVLGLQAVCESDGVSQGLFPSVGFRSFSIDVVLNAAIRFLRPLGSTLVFNISDYQSQSLQHRHFVRELAPGCESLYAAGH